MTSDSQLDMGPLGDRPVPDGTLARALAGFRTRLAAFGLGTPPSPILAPTPADGSHEGEPDHPTDR